YSPSVNVTQNQRRDEKRCAAGRRGGGPFANVGGSVLSFFSLTGSHKSLLPEAPPISITSAPSGWTRQRSPGGTTAVAWGSTITAGPGISAPAPSWSLRKTGVSSTPAAKRALRAWTGRGVPCSGGSVLVGRGPVRPSEIGRAHV